MDKRTILWRISHGLKWENKLPKLKRSIKNIRGLSPSPLQERIAGLPKHPRLEPAPTTTSPPPPPPTPIKPVEIKSCTYYFSDARSYSKNWAGCIWNYFQPSKLELFLLTEVLFSPKRFEKHTTCTIEKHSSF